MACAVALSSPLPTKGGGSGVYLPACWRPDLRRQQRAGKRRSPKSYGAFWSVPDTRRACLKAWTSLFAVRCWRAKAGRCGRQDVRCLTEALLKAANDGRAASIQLLLDASTATARMKHHLAGRCKSTTSMNLPRLASATPAHLRVSRVRVALHINCSVRRSGSEAKCAG